MFSLCFSVGIGVYAVLAPFLDNPSIGLASGAVVVALVAVLIDVRFPALDTETVFDWSVVTLWLTAGVLAYPFAIGDWWTAFRSA